MAISAATIRNEDVFLKLINSIEQPFIFSDNECKIIESHVENVIEEAHVTGKYTEWTIDETLLRKKYFFGERYTYGFQNSVANNNYKNQSTECLYPKKLISPIPLWIHTYVINPLILYKILPPNFINSVTINDYKPKGCIVSHIDPPHIFDRPIISVNLFAESALCFGCKFDFKPIRCSEPFLSVPLPRGVVTSISGFAANEITHCVRPEDTKQRRAVIILRRVFPSAPRLTESELLRLQSSPLSPVRAQESLSSSNSRNKQRIHKGRIEKPSNRSGAIKGSKFKKVFYANNTRFQDFAFS